MARSFWAKPSGEAALSSRGNSANGAHGRLPTLAGRSPLFTRVRRRGVLRTSPVRGSEKFACQHPAYCSAEGCSWRFDRLTGNAPWRSYDFYVVFLRKFLSETHGGLRVFPGRRQTLRQFL